MTPKPTHTPTEEKKTGSILLAGGMYYAYSYSHDTGLYTLDCGRKGHERHKRKIMKTISLPWIIETPTKIEKESGLYYQLMSQNNDWNSKDPQIIGFIKLEENAAFIVQACNRDEAQERMIKVAVTALTELARNPNRVNVDLFANAALERMKEEFSVIAAAEKEG